MPCKPSWWLWGTEVVDGFFFFQAEDGIRDLTVTGVQTCALPIFVMEYIDGVALPRWMTRTPPPGRSDRVRLALQLTTALDAAHKNGIVHRDIKQIGRASCRERV